MYLGINNVGSPFDPADGHDHSSQAKDKLVARTVVIEAGGAVQFQIDPFHRVNVYRAGTTFGDIDQSKLIDFVMCNFFPHYAFNSMYGWVIVK